MRLLVVVLFLVLELIARHCGNEGAVSAVGGTVLEVDSDGTLLPVLGQDDVRGTTVTLSLEKDHLLQPQVHAMCLYR